MPHRAPVIPEKRRSNGITVNSRGWVLGTERLRSAGAAEQVEYRLRRKDGAEGWALIANSPLFDASGQYLRALAMVTDIIERRRAEQTQQVLAEASRVFAEAGLEPHAALETISRYVAQVLGDGVIAFLAAEDGQQLELAGVYHSNPEAVARTRVIGALSAVRD